MSCDSTYRCLTSVQMLQPHGMAESFCRGDLRNSVGLCAPVLSAGLHDDHAASEDGDGSDTEGGSDQSEESGGTIDGTSGSAGSSPPRRSRSRSPPPAHVPPGNAYGAVGFAYNYAPEQGVCCAWQSGIASEYSPHKQSTLAPVVLS
jgi:hypothetical protein